MAILPSPTELIVNGTYKIYASNITETFKTEPFERIEFSNNKLKAAKNPDGTLPIFLTTFSGKPVQVSTTCSEVSIRPITPDDSNINSIYRRFNIASYQIDLDHSPPSSIDYLLTTATDHAKRLSEFATYLKTSQGADVSYDYLLTLQSQTFSYLTSTSFSITGIGLSISNGLITNFQEGFLIENVAAGTIISKGGQLTVEVRTETYAANPS